MSSDERILRLENAFSTLTELAARQHERITRLEESFVMLVEMTRRHGEGMEELRAAQAESEHKLAALADAQAHTDRRLDALIDIVRNERDGQSPSN